MKRTFRVWKEERKPETIMVCQWWEPIILKIPQPLLLIRTILIKPVFNSHFKLEDWSHMAVAWLFNNKTSCLLNNRSKDLSRRNRLRETKSLKEANHEIVEDNL